MKRDKCKKEQVFKGPFKRYDSDLDCFLIALWDSVVKMSTLSITKNLNEWIQNCDRDAILIIIIVTPCKRGINKHLN